MQYSAVYSDDTYEYRHVILPPSLHHIELPNRLLKEHEWRELGVQQSRGWQHYLIYRPEKHVLAFRRLKGTDPKTGLPPQAKPAPASLAN